MSATTDHKLLDQCLAAGSIAVLFSLLADWSETDLRAVMTELDEYFRSSMRRIESLYASPDSAASNLATRCAEIISVVYYYLDRNYGVTKL